MGKTGWIVLLGLCLLLSGCAGGSGAEAEPGETDTQESTIDTSAFLHVVGEDADTVDPQCTSEHYIIALNTFDRLVEVRTQENGESVLVPSLAKEWAVSEDGLVYTFLLQEGVTFSNGSALTASDVGYTLRRLLTHPDSVNQDVAFGILGAKELRSGKAVDLAGFQELSPLSFSITLEYPDASFLARLSTPGASILDEESTKAAGNSFGISAEQTIGTGPFIFRRWLRGTEMILTANKTCWSGAPACEGLDILILQDDETQRLFFEQGKLDILDLENVDNEAEYLLHGDIYQPYLVHGSRVGISYIALNASIAPLDDVRVRKALQISLDRKTLLNALYGGRGQVENGIFPHGLIGYQPDLPEIPWDPAQAAALLEEAGYEDGFDLEISVNATNGEITHDLLELCAFMWGKIGVRATVVELQDEEFMQRRRSGALACYTSTWSADYNDPDNFIFTFFGSRENTDGRSLCYQDERTMQQVVRARFIQDAGERLSTYHELERKIVQEDAAWIPLFSREHYFIVAEGVEGFQVAWNGWSNTCYRDVSVNRD